MGMWPSAERSRIARRRLPNPMYPPSGKRRSQSPESSGPRCVCTFVIRTSDSRSPQFTRPLMPHMASVPPRLWFVLWLVLQFVDFRFGMEHLHRLKGAVDQARHAIEKSETNNIAVQEEQNWRTGQAIETPLEPSPALRLSAKQIGAHRFRIRGAFRLQEHARFPVRVLIVLEDVARQGIDIVVDQRVVQLRGGPIYHHVFVDFDVGHGGILILQAAFKAASPFAEERKLPETCIAMPQGSPEKIHLQANGISVHPGLLQRTPNFFDEFRGRDFIGVEQQNPVVG